MQLIYLHGFNSSPLSAKAQQLKRYFAERGISQHLSVPALSPSPQVSIQLLQDEIAKHEEVCLLGSSLGGFYATWLAEQQNIKAALINPAVAPWKLLDKSTAIQYNYHTGEAWQLDPSWIDELRRFEVTHLSRPQNILLLTQTADETLDWHHGWDFYQQCNCVKWLGGSHSFDEFDAFLPLILRFLGIDKR